MLKKHVNVRLRFTYKLITIYPIWLKSSEEMSNPNGKKKDEE